MRKTTCKCDYCGNDIYAFDDRYSGDAKHFMLELVGYNTFATTNKLRLDLCEECGTKVQEMLERGKKK